MARLSTPRRGVLPGERVGFAQRTLQVEEECDRQRRHVGEFVAVASECLYRGRLMGMGIDPATYQNARVAQRLWIVAEQAFGDVVMKAFKLRMNVFERARVQDVTEHFPVPSPGTPGEG